jgi:hypothetical protein
VHNELNDCAPGYLAELLTAVADIPSRASLRNASKHCLDVPRTKLKMGDRAFSVAAPQAYNRLDPALRNITDTSSFKNKLKTFYF